MQYLGLVDDDDEYGYEYEDEYGEQYSEPPAYPATASSAPVEPVPEAPRRVAPAEPSGVSVLRTAGGGREPVAVDGTPAVRPVAPGAAGARVHVMEPRGFNDAQEVGDRLKSSQPVILNLQGVDRDLQRRLIDFSSGLAYALGGRMSKAADQVFLLTPSNVSVPEEEKDRLEAEGLYRR